MARPLIVDGPQTPEEVEAAYRAATDPRHRERLLAVHMAQLGELGLRGIARALMRGRNTILRWVKAFRAGGIDALLKPPEHKGRHPTPSVRALIELEEGLANGRWKGAREIQVWLAEQHQVNLTLKGVYYWLGRFRGRPKVPQTSHAEKNPQEVQAFKEHFEAELAPLAETDGKPLHVWVEDEHRYGLRTETWRVWTEKGLQPVVPVEQKREWEYAYAALDVVTGAAEFAYTPTVSLEWTREFLKQLVATDPEAVHVVIWDNAGYHPLPGDAGLPDGIRVLPLPAYSPELNPTEAVWGEVKRKMANVVYGTLAQAEAAITKALRPLWESAARVRQLLGKAWLTQAVLAFLARAHGLNPI